MNVGLVIPSVHDSLGRWKSVFIEKMIPSLVHISNVNNLRFLFNFQGYEGDDKNLVIEAIKKINEFNDTWQVQAIFNPMYNPVSMIRIRNDCMMQSPNLPLYVFLDDDVIFHDGSGDCYNEIIEFFKVTPELGLVMSAGFLGGYNYKHTLRYSDQKWYWTNRGLFFRNFRKIIGGSSPIFTDESISECVGGYEDAVVAIEILAMGFKLATHFNNPASHRSNQWKEREQKILADRLKKSVADDEIDYIHQAPCSGLQKYLKDKFNYSGPIEVTKDFLNLMKEISRRDNV